MTQNMVAMLSTFNGETVNRIAWNSLALILLLPWTLLCQTGEDVTSSKGWPNGKFWVLLDKQGKANHLSGLQGGINLLANEMMKETGSENEWDRIDERRNSLVLSGFTMTDIVHQVDVFFADRLNERIPIAYAYLYSIKNMSGESPDQLGVLLNALRREWGM